MKTIMKETFIALALLVTTTSIKAQCLPCGEVITNANLPSQGPSLYPIDSYVASATCCKNPNNYFGGFYAGLAWGVGATSYHLQIQNSSPFGIDDQTRSYLVADGNVGFNLVLNCFFAVGVELGYDYRSRSNPISYFPLNDLIAVFFDFPDPFDDRLIAVEPCKVRYDINSQHGVHADLLPAVVYKQFTAYLRFGIEQSKYDLQRRVCFPSVLVVEDDGFTVTIDDTDFIFSPAHRNIAGYRLGAGFGIAATRHISFHLNYIHTFVNKQSFTPDVNPIIANSPVLIPDPDAPDPDVIPTISLRNLGGKVSIEPQRDEVTFGVRFTF